jgi:hypothetical protein
MIDYSLPINSFSGAVFDGNGDPVVQIEMYDSHTNHIHP